MIAHQAELFPEPPEERAGVDAMTAPGTTAVEQTVETVPVAPEIPFDRLSDTVERRKKFSAPGAHLEQDALAAEIARKTREKFHLPE